MSDEPKIHRDVPDSVRRAREADRMERGTRLGNAIGLAILAAGTAVVLFCLWQALRP